MAKKYSIQKNLSPPEVVQYVRLQLPSKVFARESLSEELGKLILLKAQGEAVEIAEDLPIPILMAAFDIVHKVSPEMVLKLKNNQRVLIFDHWGRPVIRDENIIVIDKVKNSSYWKDKIGEFIADFVFNLEDIWSKAVSVETNDLEATKKALKEIKKLLKPSISTTIVGKAPALLCLLVQHLLYGKTGEIWYQDSLATKPIRITKL